MSSNPNYQHISNDSAIVEHLYILIKIQKPKTLRTIERRMLGITMLDKK